MQPRFSRAEYWLLENVVDRLFPLCHLGDSAFCSQLYKAGHGLDRQPLIELLHELFTAGLIAADRMSEEVPFAPTIAQIASALDEPGPTNNQDCLFYGLTERGGALWEQFAFPDWRRFISYRPGELTGMRQELVEEHLKGMHHIGLRVLAGSERWDLVQPWKATGWKTLPHGHRVSFAFTEDGYYDFDAVPYRFRMLHRWYDWGTW
jgi:hypothetical protein